MRGKILIALVLTVGLGGCSTFSDSKMVTMNQRDADDALKVPKYMLTAQASNVGVGEGRATDAQTSRDLADHYAKVDLCRKLVVTANSRVRTTAAQTAKGSRSNTAITGTVAGCHGGISIRMAGLLKAQDWKVLIPETLNGTALDRTAFWAVWSTQPPKWSSGASVPGSGVRGLADTEGRT